MHLYVARIVSAPSINRCDHLGHWWKCWEPGRALWRTCLLSVAFLHYRWVFTYDNEICGSWEMHLEHCKLDGLKHVDKLVSWFASLVLWAMCHVLIEGRRLIFFFYYHTSTNHWAFDSQNSVTSSDAAPSKWTCLVGVVQTPLISFINFASLTWHLEFFQQNNTRLLSWSRIIIPIWQYFLIGYWSL